MKTMWEKSMAAWRSRLFAFLALAAAALPAWSQGAIQSPVQARRARSKLALMPSRCSLRKRRAAGKRGA